MELNRKIIKVDTKIEKLSQKIIFHFDDGNPIVEIPFLAVSTQFPSIKVTEVELLIGSLFKQYFYNRGETLKDGSICNSEDNFKGFNLELDGSLEACIERNKSHFRKFQKIRNIDYLEENKKKPFFIIDLGGGNVSFLSRGYYLNLTGGLKFDQCKSLKGAFITTEFLKKGESSDDMGYIVTAWKDDVMLANPCIRTQNDLILIGTSKSIEKTTNKLNYPSTNDDHTSKSYNQYGGPTDGYGGSLDDDFINDALGGEPDAIWNID